MAVSSCNLSGRKVFEMLVLHYSVFTEMYNCCVYLTNHVSGVSVCDCFGMADLVLIDGFLGTFWE